MRVALRICSEKKSELYNIKTDGTLSFIKEVNPDSSDLQVSSVKAIIFSTNLHFWKSVDYEKILIQDRNQFIFPEDAISEVEQIYFSSVSHSVEKNLVSQAWIRKDKLYELLRIWNLKDKIPLYPESLLENEFSKGVGDISKLDISGFKIITKSEFLLSKSQDKRFTVSLLLFISFLLLGFNVYTYNFVDKKDEYLGLNSRIMNVLNDLSQVYSDFAPGSVQEISMLDGGKNILVTLLDANLDISKIKEKLNNKYSIDFEDNIEPQLLIFKEKVLDND